MPSDAGKYIPFLDPNREAGKFKTEDIGTDTLLAEDIAPGAVGTSELADAAVNQSKLSYEVVAITVAAAATSGTGTCTSGSIILGYYSTGNQDQLVDSVAVSGTTVTITLAAAATAANTFNVVLLKA